MWGNSGSSSAGGDYQVITASLHPHIAVIGSVVSQ